MPALATAPTARRLFPACPCPTCAAVGTVSLSLHDGDEMHCGACGDTFSIGHLKALIEAWTPILDALDSDE